MLQTLLGVVSFSVHVFQGEGRFDGKEGFCVLVLLGVENSGAVEGVDALKEEGRELRGVMKIGGSGCQRSGNAPSSRANSPSSTTDTSDNDAGEANAKKQMSFHSGTSYSTVVRGVRSEACSSTKQSKEMSKNKKKAP